MMIEGDTTTEKTESVHLTNNTTSCSRHRDRSTHNSSSTPVRPGQQILPPHLPAAIDHRAALEQEECHPTDLADSGRAPGRPPRGTSPASAAAPRDSSPGATSDPPPADPPPPTTAAAKIRSRRRRRRRRRRRAGPAAAPPSYVPRSSRCRRCSAHSSSSSSSSSCRRRHRSSGRRRRGTSPGRDGEPPPTAGRGI